MTTERLHMAIKNFDNMNQMVERYTRLCRAYVKLSEQFHQLDIEHMKLKGNMVPLLKAVKVYKNQNTQLEQQNQELQQTLVAADSLHRSEVQNLVATYEEQLQSLKNQIDELKALEWFTTEDAHRDLAEAEQQIALDEETFQEIAQDALPDLTEDEKALLVEYHANPANFVVQGLEPILLEQSTANGRPSLETSRW
ncbi:hypothetical protein [Pseudanabaena sp. FACHB-2040]|uniref:hypothetical protein n=1 Tax=Pseudanabaena sp. FACHB-2040 TaxID=2692859 RepID=UPI0016864AA0|nr:hypothetical protein [Pseudanabaena sp. FACHB-2040]MBD2257344.1 hypothetical protein [Pseudanabaena sp. FACHB-2040]